MSILVATRVATKRRVRSRAEFECEECGPPDGCLTLTVDIAENGLDEANVGNHK